MSTTALSRVATVVLVLAMFSLLFRHVVFADTPATIALQLVAAALMLWARITFGLRSFHAVANPTAGGLVTSGPYRWVRHPIYAAILLFIWACVASHWSLLTAATAVVASAAIAVRVGAEERLVAQRYPEYVGYAARTKRIIPFVF